MIRFLLPLVAALALATGCAVPIHERNVTILMAKKVTKDGGPYASEITEVFNFEGPIFAYLTFTWDGPDKSGGAQSIEARWFNGDREISKRQLDANFGRPPHYAWFQTTGAALGTGNCRVDIYVRGNRVGSKSFRVVEK